MASTQYFIRNPEETYFLTMTVVDWVDVFTRDAYKCIVVDSLRFCQENKGLILYGWCLMSNHLHLLAAAQPNFDLSDIVRDFKKFTSKKIVRTMQEIPESRREWMLHRFSFAGKYRSNIENFKFWQDGNRAKACVTPEFAHQKLAYLHDNPVRARIVETPEDYLHSSARNYAGKAGLLEVMPLFG